MATAPARIWNGHPRRVPVGLSAMDELTARRAKSFGPVAATYDRVRPGYPPDGVLWLLEGAHVPGAVGTARAPGAIRPAGTTGAGRTRCRVLDMGAGTGALT